MKPGPLIRAMFGPRERWVTGAYRRLYIDVDEFAVQLHEWVPAADRILEIGCGEGAVTEKIVAAYPQAEITAIDVTSRLGRLYEGPRDRVHFVQATAQEIAAREPGHYNMAVLCDVLHHVPLAERQDLLSAIRTTLAPGGIFVFKDWERSTNLIHWLCYVSDRWLTGDRVSYMSCDEMERCLTRSFGETALVGKVRLRPWRNNVVLMIRP